jgi:hypothetical protein
MSDTLFAVKNIKTQKLFIYLDEREETFKVIHPDGSIKELGKDIFEDDIGEVSFESEADLSHAGITAAQISTLILANQEEAQTPTRTGETPSWQRSRLTFIKKLIEPLGDNDMFIAGCPEGTFQMTKGQFKRDGANIYESYSYQTLGTYNCQNLPHWALKYKVR